MNHSPEVKIQEEEKYLRFGRVGLTLCSEPAGMFEHVSIGSLCDTVWYVKCHVLITKEAETKVSR